MDFKPFIDLCSDARAIISGWERKEHPRANIALALVLYIRDEWTDEQKSDFLKVATVEFDPTADAPDPAEITADASTATLAG